MSVEPGASAFSLHVDACGKTPLRSNAGSPWPRDQATTFGFVLLPIIGEAIEQFLLGNDPSMTSSAIVIVTLLFPAP